MRDIPRADHGVEFVGGSVALDFANTLGGTHSAPTHEHLVEYRDLVEFARSAGTISSHQARRLIDEAARQPARAAAMLRRATALRETIWRVFDAFAKGARAEPSDLATIHDEELAALRNARFAQTATGVGYEWSDELRLERPLWAIGRSAADLLRSSEDLRLVRECDSATCEWLFIDRSRNHTRRWCDMADCGNRAKQRRLRARASRNVSSALRS